jgi:hypothetical protein
LEHIIGITTLELKRVKVNEKEMPDKKGRLPIPTQAKAR